MFYELDKLLSSSGHQVAEVNDVFGVLMMTNEGFASLARQSAPHFSESVNGSIDVDMRAENVHVPIPFGGDHHFPVDLSDLYADWMPTDENCECQVQIRYAGMFTGVSRSFLLSVRFDGSRLMRNDASCYRLLSWGDGSRETMAYALKLVITVEKHGDEILNVYISRPLALPAYSAQLPVDAEEMQGYLEGMINFDRIHCNLWYCPKKQADTPRSQCKQITIISRFIKSWHITSHSGDFQTQSRVPLKRMLAPFLRRF